MKKIGLIIISLMILALMTACGSESQEGGTITFIKGEPAEVPDVTNVTLTAAQDTLSEAGFTNIISQYYKGDVRNPDRMMVTEQSCPAGESVDRYTEIVLTCKKLCGLNLDIASNGNWFFSKYDMLVSLDGKELGTVANGDTLSANLDIVEGEHVLQVVRTDDPSLTAEYRLQVTEDMGFACTLSHSEEEISFGKIMLDVGAPEVPEDTGESEASENAGEPEISEEAGEPEASEEAGEPDDTEASSCRKIRI